MFFFRVLTSDLVSKEKEKFYFSGFHFLTIAVDWLSSNIRISIWYGSIYEYLRNKYLLVEFNYILIKSPPASSFTRPISISSRTVSLARIRLQGWNHCWKAKTRARSTKAERATMTGSTKERVHSLSAA